MIQIQLIQGFDTDVSRNHNIGWEVVFDTRLANLPHAIILTLT